jgi:hypothetical protein
MHLNIYVSGSDPPNRSGEATADYPTQRGEIDARVIGNYDAITNAKIERNES